MPKHFPVRTQLTVEFAEQGEDCEMTFTQAGVDSDTVEGAWRAMFDRLSRIVTSR